MYNDTSSLESRSPEYLDKKVKELAYGLVGNTTDTIARSKHCTDMQINCRGGEEQTGVGVTVGRQMRLKEVMKKKAVYGTTDSQSNSFAKDKTG